jgi:hypothetical protein
LQTQKISSDDRGALVRMNNKSGFFTFGFTAIFEL